MNGGVPSESLPRHPLVPAPPPETGRDELEELLAAADAAGVPFSSSSVGDRARWLRAAADALDDATDELVPLAQEESHLPGPRLQGEVQRSSGQLRLFAHALERGILLEATVDTADPDFVPVARPDLRRMLVGIGPVLVFAASNFPFAFSVCGGDVAAALAAGCPVLVKGHPGHPRLSALTAELMDRALRGAGAPAGCFGLVLGDDAGVRALQDPRIKASGFTGSVAGGTALHRIAMQRPDPIPFYGELGSLNPVFVLPGAARQRGAQIAREFVASFTLGVGQFCTKPGLLLLPHGHGLEEELVAATRDGQAAPMLNGRVRDAFTTRVAQLHGEVAEVLVAGRSDAHGVSSSLLSTSVSRLLAQPGHLLEECFGPASVIAEYDGVDEMCALAQRLSGQLTATIQAEAQDLAAARVLLPILQERAGRVVHNGWPTGVAVTWAMNHGGPFPATIGSVHTSVGTTAARRFQRPVCFQDVPDALLPEPLRDANPGRLERRVNGEVSTGDAQTASR